MAGPDKRAKPLTFQELTELRRKTEIVSKFLQEQLAAHLVAVRLAVHAHHAEHQQTRRGHRASLYRTPCQQCT